MDLLVNTLKFIAGSAVDVLPIAIFLFAFQWLVIGGKMPNAYPYSEDSAQGMKKLMNFLWVKTPLGRWLS